MPGWIQQEKKSVFLGLSCES